jgi:hypothetical protein
VLGGALAAVWRNITADREAKAAEDAKERDRESNATTRFAPNSSRWLPCTTVSSLSAASSAALDLTYFLGDDTDQVVTNLGRIENRLNRVLELWEKSGWTIQQGTPLWLVSDGLKLLLRVTEHLRPEVSNPLREITELINKHVFGEAMKETQDALAAIVSEHEKREPEDGER